VRFVQRHSSVARVALAPRSMWNCSIFA
jgi:hypothetical protein